MKPQGRSPKPFTEADLAMVKEYLESDKSFKEVSAKYKISAEGLRYRVNKYRKELERNKEDSEDNQRQIIVLPFVVFYTAHKEWAEELFSPATIKRFLEESECVVRVANDKDGKTIYEFSLKANEWETQ